MGSPERGPQPPDEGFEIQVDDATGTVKRIEKGKRIQAAEETQQEKLDK